MGIVQMTVNLSSDFTTIKVVGKTTADDLRFWVSDFYAGKVTSLVLWDLANADLTEIGPKVTIEEVLAHIQQVNKAAADARKGGKTAYFVGDNIDAHRLCKMIEAIAEVEGAPFERQTFTTIDEAKKWLGVSGMTT